MIESHTQPNTSPQSFKSKIKQIQGQTLMAETWQTSQPKSKYLQGLSSLPNHRHTSLINDQTQYLEDYKPMVLYKMNDPKYS